MFDVHFGCIVVQACGLGNVLNWFVLGMYDFDVTTAAKVVPRVVLLERQPSVNSLVPFTTKKADCR